MIERAEEAAALPRLNGAQLDFLRLVVASSENHLRAFDTKAQIMLAAFVLSLGPLWAMLRAACNVPSYAATIATMFLSVLTIVTYGATVWPTSPKNGTSPGAFFIGGKTHADGSHYLKRLARISVEEELASEALKLASIRQSKSGRLKLALLTTVLTYGAMLVLFLTGTQCR